MRWLDSRSRALAVLALLATLLGAGAPLAHAHLDASAVAAAGLCGDPHDTGDTSRDVECTLCLAGAHARALVVARALPVPPQPEALRVAEASRPLHRPLPESAPGHPRAPPHA